MFIIVIVIMWLLKSSVVATVLAVTPRLLVMPLPGDSMANSGTLRLLNPDK